MLAQALSRRFAGSGIYYGWMIVAVAFFVSVTTSGVMGLPGALMLPLGREFGWNTEQVSGALALRILLYGLMAPFAAALIERYGLRRIVLCALLFISCGLVLALAMNRVWQLVLLFGVVVGLGTGMTALVFSTIVATRWFTERRGLVVGILTASFASGQLVFLPLAAWLESRYGWRAALAPSLVGSEFPRLSPSGYSWSSAPTTWGSRPTERPARRRRPRRMRRRSGRRSGCSAKSPARACSGFSPRHFLYAASALTG